MTRIRLDRTPNTTRSYDVGLSYGGPFEWVARIVVDPRTRTIEVRRGALPAPIIASITRLRGIFENSWATREVEDAIRDASKMRPRKHNATRYEAPEAPSIGRTRAEAEAMYRARAETPIVGPRITPQPVSLDWRDTFIRPIGGRSYHSDDRGEQVTLSCGYCGLQTRAHGHATIVVGFFMKVCSVCTKPRAKCECPVDITLGEPPTKTILISRKAVGCPTCADAYNAKYLTEGPTAFLNLHESPNEDGHPRKAKSPSGPSAASVRAMYGL